MNNRLGGTEAAEVMQVIKTVAKRGSGTDYDPVRTVVQIWSLDGEFIAEDDPVVYACLREDERKDKDFPSAQ